MPDFDEWEIFDAKVIAAMAHPLRRRLLDVLGMDGPSTVSVLAGRTGQAIGNISHHLKVLAASGLVEEVPELARDRRERWWRRVSAGLAASGSYSEQWRPVAFDTHSWARLTPDELSEIGDELTAVIKRWSDRELPDDGRQRDPVFLFARGMPGNP